MFEPKIIIADFKTSLAAKITVGGVSGSIQNNLDDDGVMLPAGKYYFTLDADSAQKEHITCDLAGKVLSNIKSVSRQGVETEGTLREHRIGAPVSITDFAHIKMINDFAMAYDGKWSGSVTDFAALLLVPSSTRRSKSNYRRLKDLCIQRNYLDSSRSRWGSRNSLRNNQTRKRIRRWRQ